MQAAHDEWVAGRKKAGWRWGIELDIKAKAHPNLMPWGELPEPDRMCDHLMYGVVRCLMSPL